MPRLKLPRAIQTVQLHHLQEQTADPTEPRLAASITQIAAGLALLGLSLAPAFAESPRIYRCQQADGLPLFSRTACASAHQLAPVITNSYQPTDLTKLEQQQLKVIAGNQRKLEAQRKARANKSLRAEQDGSTSACQRHQQALEALHNRRRKGYKLSEATRLDQQEQSLRQNVRLHC